MMTAVQETKTRLTQARVPLVRTEAGCANERRAAMAAAGMVLARGVDGLAWARAKMSMDDTAMTNAERWEKVEADAGEADDEIRRDKVERLRAAIANGTYSVSVEALAEKMIEHMREAEQRSAEKIERQG